MDIFYYSNFCPHSQKVIQFIVKNQLNDKISCICVDKRTRDGNNQYMVTLENGKQVMLPPNLQSIPAILCVKKNYTLILGTEPIIEYVQSVFNLSLNSQQLFENPYESTVNTRPQYQDPVGFIMTGNSNNNGILSEAYTSYDLSPDDLSAQSNSKNRPMYHYTPVNNNFRIEAPEDSYRPDKISSNVTIDVLQHQRNQEIPAVAVQPPKDLYM
uniref:Glutaredoxin domain-containing protein n=1 Tax=viral metagenome TaxID=1070528 RepID=A0A6C0HVA5_9ZZZZ